MSTTINKPPVLYPGSQGELVKSVQKFLRDIGHYFGSINGYFCSDTEKSVREFQKQIGIPSDGVVNERTWKAIARIRIFLGI